LQPAGAVLTGLYVRLAETLSALQIAMFTLLVWVPVVAAGSLSAFQWSESIVPGALTVGAWMVADSCRRTVPRRDSSYFGSKRGSAQPALDVWGFHFSFDRGFVNWQLHGDC
jgi:hypothetical protein